MTDQPDPLRDRCKKLLVMFEERRPIHHQNSFVLLQTQNVDDLMAFVRDERKAGELHTALEAIVFTIAFLGRDAGSGRLETTVPALIKRLADADTAIRAVL